ncbi:hypothetical protein PTTG_28517 [Puccinia triticina 1-1 BBBD Race 1]|uniref:Uncharacterized protein n=1 Tax=Puccinia triticina (isolate 1-1 / race 1 (BBBD)) TaxID=630390 RepID=A0A180GD48_PUCT1|nr:hypothetical protein PTTG_28517 [Puccinia triticina 1-1 BBBD Race 1]
MGDIVPTAPPQPEQPPPPRRSRKDQRIVKSEWKEQEQADWEYFDTCVVYLQEYKTEINRLVIHSNIETQDNTNPGIAPVDKDAGEELIFEEAVESFGPKGKETVNRTEPDFIEFMKAVPRIIEWKLNPANIRDIRRICRRNSGENLIRLPFETHSIALRTAFEVISIPLRLSSSATDNRTEFEHRQKYSFKNRSSPAGYELKSSIQHGYLPHCDSSPHRELALPACLRPTLPVMENREPSSRHDDGGGENQSGISQNAQSQPRRNEAPAPLPGDDDGLSGDDDGPPPPRRLVPRKRKSTIERLQALCPDMFNPSRAEAKDRKPSPSLLVDQLQSSGSSTPPNPKRAKSSSSSPPSEGDLTMEAYLDLCHIQPGDSQTHAAIERHSLYHWLVLNFIFCY